MHGLPLNQTTFTKYGERPVMATSRSIGTTTRQRRFSLQLYRFLRLLYKAFLALLGADASESVRSGSKEAWHESIKIAALHKWRPPG